MAKIRQVNYAAPKNSPQHRFITDINIRCPENLREINANFLFGRLSYYTYTSETCRLNSKATETNPFSELETIPIWFALLNII